MEEPLVSIVTPTFNMAGRLPACVASVRRQTYPRVEHIVIDGGSNDGTVEYLRSQPSLRWISEPDQGQSDAINKGFALARGSLLTWLNADDLLSTETVSLVVDGWRLNPAAGWYIGDLEVRSRGRSWIVRPPPTVDQQSFVRGNVVSQPGTFFTRAALDAVGAIDVDFNLTMDFELWLRFIDAALYPVYIPRVLATFEIHPDSKTGAQGGLRFAEEEARALNKHGRPHDAALAIDRWYWDTSLNEMVRLLREGRYQDARTMAAATRLRLHPVFGRARLFTLATQLSPPLARALARLKRNRPMA